LKNSQQISTLKACEAMAIKYYFNVEFAFTEEVRKHKIANNGKKTTKIPKRGNIFIAVRARYFLWPF